MAAAEEKASSTEFLSQQQLALTQQTVDSLQEHKAHLEDRIEEIRRQTNARVEALEIEKHVLEERIAAHLQETTELKVGLST